MDILKNMPNEVFMASEELSGDESNQNSNDFGARSTTGELFYRSNTFLILLIFYNIRFC